MQNKVFIWVAVVTVLLLMVPFLLINFRIPLYDPGSGFEIINWDIADFVVMGTLIFGAGSMFIFVARKIRKRTHQIALAVAFLLGFLWIWAELAVGIFTNWGS